MCHPTLSNYLRLANYCGYLLLSQHHKKVKITLSIRGNNKKFWPSYPNHSYLVNTCIAYCQRTLTCLLLSNPINWHMKNAPKIS